VNWSERAQLYRESEAHREGEDLDLVVEWSAGAQTGLDVATGGGHVARRLREFADDSFDVVACRVALHHFDDVAKAVSEMARVSRDRVIVVDNLFVDDAAEEADRVRDPSHVRNLSEEEWREVFAAAALRVDEVRRIPKPIEVEPWLQRVATPEAEAQQVRELLADRIEEGWVTLDRIAILGRK
jgi:SAM-dependent methyltransferase